MFADLRRRAAPAALLAAIAAAPAAAQAPAPASGAAQPAARWAVDGSTDRCVLQRRLQGTPVPATFILRTIPGSGRYDVILASPDLSADIRRPGRRSVLSLAPSGASIRAEGVAVDLPDALGDGVVFGPLPAEFAAAFANASALQLGDQDGKAVASWTIPLAARAAEALRYCEAEKQVEWGADPAAHEPGATPARPIGNAAGWLTPRDFGALTSLEPAAYTAAFRLVVGTDGRVAECRLIESAGNVDFSRACRSLSSRARFEPARSAAGTPVRSVSIHWISATVTVEFRG